MAKVTIYYPYTKDMLGFSEEKFKSIYALFPKLEFNYINDADTFLKALSKTDYLFARGLSQEEYSHACNLKALFVYSAGKELVCNEALTNLTCYFGQFHGQLMAESLLGAMLYFNQQYPKILQLQHNKKWSQTNDFSQRKLLAGQKVALIGYGSIGSYCARLLNNFAVKIYAVQRTHSSGVCPLSGAQFIHEKDIDNILANCEHIVSLLPYSKETINYFNAEFFAKLAPSAYFYNLGRGHAVNESDLITVLNNNQLAGAMLDVVATEPLSEISLLWTSKNLLLTPHISAFYQNYVDFYLTELVTQLSNELAK